MTSTEMSMLTTYCGKHVQNLCVCDWTTLKNARRIGRGKGTYPRRGAHSNYISNTWSLHSIKEYQKKRVTRTMWKFQTQKSWLSTTLKTNQTVIITYYDSSSNCYCLSFFFPFKLPTDTCALNHFGHLGLIYSKRIHVYVKIC